MFPRTRPSTWFFAALPAVLTAFLFSCSSGSSGGGSPAVLEEDELALNDAPLDAGVAALTPSRAGHGVLDDETDIDFWSIPLTAGRVVSVELFGTRLDHAAWDGDDTIPVVTLYDTDGTTVVFHHDTSLNWGWGRHDLDFPLLRVPETGIYFAKVTAEGGAVTDAQYAIRVSLVNVGALHLETGDDGGDNDSDVNAELIAPGTVYGEHVDGNNDYYKFVITTPSVVRFETTAYRNGIFEGGDYFDPYLFLYDTDGTTGLTEVDDAFFYDSALHALLPPGTYFLNVSEHEESTGDAPYFLTYSRTNAGGGVESEPNDSFATADSIAYGGSITGTFETPALSLGPPEVDYVKFNGQQGDMVRIQRFDSGNSFSEVSVDVEIVGPDEVTALDWGGDDDLQTQTTILQETGPHYLVISGFDVNGSEYRVELTSFRTATPEIEPNNDVEDANALGGGGRSAGVIEDTVLVGVADVDTFSFSATVNRLTTISIYASDEVPSDVGSDGFDEFSGHGSSLNPTLRILDATRLPIAVSKSNYLTVSSESVTNGLPCAAVSFIPSESGTYYVEVTDSFNNSGSSHYYVIERTN